MAEDQRVVAGRELRDYQIEAVEAMENAPDGAHLVQMATGLGKTVTMAAYRPQGRILILSHRDELVHQPQRYYSCPFGVEMAGETSHGEPVVSASVQSMVRRLGRFHQGDFDTVFTDEAHHALAPSYRKIIAYLRPRKHIGLTATPRRGDQRGLDTVFEDIIFERDLKWGIQHGWLTDIDAHRVSVSWDTRGIRQIHGDYDQRALSQRVNNLETNEQVAQAYQDLRVGQTLIFASSVEHAHELSALIPRSHYVDANTPRDERRRMIQDFTDRRFDCLINYGIFTEGTDIPLIETILLARPTSNETLYAQMVGRGLRPYPGKDHLTLIDCVGLTEDARLCTPASLIGIEESDLTPHQRDQMNGSLMKMSDRIEGAADTPSGWVLEARRVRLLHPDDRIAWTYLPDGGRVAHGKSYDVTLSRPDQLGHIPAHVSLRRRYNEERKKNREYDFLFRDMRAADDAVFELLRISKPYERALWDAEAARRWGDGPASDRQLGYIRHLIGAEQLAELGPISKYEAGVIIGNMTRKNPGSSSRSSDRHTDKTTHIDHARPSKRTERPQRTKMRKSSDRGMESGNHDSSSDARSRRRSSRRIRREKRMYSGSDEMRALKRQDAEISRSMADMRRSGRRKGDPQYDSLRGRLSGVRKKMASLKSEGERKRALFRR